MLEEILNKMREAIGKGAFYEAEKVGKENISKFVNSIALHKGTGISLALQNKNDEAYRYFERAYNLDRTDQDVLYNMATLLMQLGQLQRAGKIFEELYLQGNRTLPVLLNYINVFIGTQELVKADKLCQEAFAQYPEDESLFATYLSVLEQNNKLDEAAALLKKNRVTGPAFILSARILRRMKNYSGALAELNKCNFEKLSDDAQIEFNWEKAMILERMCKYNEAWQQFSDVNNQILSSEKGQKIKPDQFWADITFMDKYLSIVSNQDRYVSNEEDKDLQSPVFFISFPRSGTTLMEQILKAHNQIVTTEERSPFQTVLNNLRMKYDLTTFFNELDENKITMLREGFWHAALKTHGDLAGKLLVDKLPLNIIWVPIIRQIFPQSKFVMVYRDPRDVCISAFMQNFKLNSAMVNFLEWQQTAKTYDAVLEIWQKTKDQNPESIFEYRYEDLTSDFLNITQKLLKFVNLPYDDNIENYLQYTKQNHVKSPSYREVINPIHQGALERWRNYALPSKEVMPYLQKWIEKFGYPLD